MHFHSKTFVFPLNAFVYISWLWDVGKILGFYILSNVFSFFFPLLPISVFPPLYHAFCFCFASSFLTLLILFAIGFRV